VPNWPAKAILNSFIAAIDRDDYAQPATEEMETRMVHFKSKTTVIFKREIMLVTHPVLLGSTITLHHFPSFTTLYSRPSRFENVSASCSAISRCT
jgi:hypothetical protein